MNRLALCLIVPFLAGCNVHSKNPASGDENVSIHADENGEIAFNLPIAEGHVKVPAMMMHNGNIDIDGVKLMPGSSVTGSSLDAHDKNANVEMSFTAPASPDEVRSYYADQFKKQGVEVAIAGDSVTGKSKDGNPFAIHVGPAPTGSQGKIEIQDKD
jgi:GTPase